MFQIQIVYWICDLLIFSPVYGDSDGKESTCNKGDQGLTPRREWQPTPVFLHGAFHEQRSLGRYSPWGGKESDMTELLTHTLQFVACLFILLLLLLLFSSSVMSNFFQHHGLKHTRPPCPSPSSGACSNSCPLSP